MRCQNCGSEIVVCRRCALLVQAEHYRDLFEEERSRVAHHGDVARLPFDRLSDDRQAGWVAVATAARDMGR